jgi:hypothetical protein
VFSRKPKDGDGDFWPSREESQALYENLSGGGKEKILRWLTLRTPSSLVWRNSGKGSAGDKKKK